MHPFASISTGFLYPFVDGFGHVHGQFVFDDNNFDIIPNSNRNIVLLKLHGSLSWKQISKEDETVIKIHPVRVDPNYLDEYMLIYPTLGMKDADYDNKRLPYHSMFQRFENLLTKTDVCIIVGFSFRDEYVSDLLRQHLDGKLVIIVDPMGKGNLRYLYRDEERIEEKIKEREINTQPEVFTYLINGIKVGIIQKKFDEIHIDEIIQIIEYCIENRDNRDLWNIRFHRQVGN